MRIIRFEMTELFVMDNDPMNMHYIPAMVPEWQGI